MELTKDYVLKGRVSLLQPKYGYRVAVDPFVLSSFVNVRDGQSVLDVGCGVGAISLILKLKNPFAQITAIDVDRDICDICMRNSEENSLDIDIINVGIENFHKNHRNNLFDHVVTNPPFFNKKSTRVSDLKLLANFETIELSDWVSCCLKNLKNGGMFYIIHHASRISDILLSLAKKAGATEIIPIFPKDGQDAIRVIVKCKKGSMESTRITSGLILHDRDGNFSETTREILEFSN
ncbi:methyltransferase [Alphaproteobacteria bacterium]|nr:methyltransferase [Alphaproteobacteria bacterium]